MGSPATYSIEEKLTSFLMSIETLTQDLLIIHNSSYASFAECFQTSNGVQLCIFTSSKTFKLSLALYFIFTSILMTTKSCIIFMNLPEIAPNTNFQSLGIEQIHALSQELLGV